MKLGSISQRVKQRRTRIRNKRKAKSKPKEPKPKKQLSKTKVNILHIALNDLLPDISIVQNLNKANIWSLFLHKIYRSKSPVHKPA